MLMKIRLVVVIGMKKIRMQAKVRKACLEHMADTLQCDCKIKNTHRPSYWWKFVYEVLKSHHFQFVFPDEPYYSADLSSYTYHHYLSPYTEDMEDSESVLGTIQNLWDEISAEIGSVTAIFWCQEDDGKYIEYDVIYTIEKEGEVSLGLLLPGGDIRDVPSTKAQARLQRFFSFCKDLFETCHPYTGNIYWENSSFVFAPWATIGDSIEELEQQLAISTAPIVHNKYQLIEQYRFTYGKTLFFWNPAPVLRRHGKEKYWNYISVL
ncbi:MAG TPA: hypothetical protein VL461_12260 [Dictyobacter sp.]|nr:hypothetical protein [Dictyobacter sp.]